MATVTLASPAMPQFYSGSGRAIVRFEYALKLPSPIDGFTWFPDNKTLLVKSGGIRLINTRDRSISQPVISETLPSWPRLLVSPDGVYLAVLAAKLRVYSATDWRPLSDWRLIPPLGKEARGRPFAQLPGGGLQFTSDSRSIWVACDPRPDKGDTAIAIKMRVPDLQVIDSIQTSITGASFSRTAITSNSSDVIEHAYFYTDKRDPKWPDRRWYRAVVGAINLEDKSVTMAPKDLTPDVGDAFGGHNDAISADHGVYVIDQEGHHAVPTSELDSVQEPRLISYDTHSLQRIREFGSNEERIGDSPVHWSGHANLVLLKGTDLAIAARATEDHFGGFRLWNVRTGELLQSLPAYGTHFLTLSPDQKRMALMHGPDEVLIYSINTAEVRRP